MAERRRSLSETLLRFYQLAHERLLKVSEEVSSEQFVWSAGPSLHSIAWQLWALLIGSVEGVKSAPTSVTRSENRWSASAGGALTMEVEETRGMDDQKPTVITNPPLAAVTQPIRQARSGDVCYSDAWETAFSGRNGFVTESRYSA
jgi:hypothetical protein